jgi:hypothetical protein
MSTAPLRPAPPGSRRAPAAWRRTRSTAGRERDFAHIAGHAAAALPHQVARLAHQQRVAAGSASRIMTKVVSLTVLKTFERIGNEQQFHGLRILWMKTATHKPRSRVGVAPASGGAQRRHNGSDLDLGAQLDHRLVGRFRKSAAAAALRCMLANSFSRHSAMPPPNAWGSRCRATGSSWCPWGPADSRGPSAASSASGTSGSFLKPK